MLPKRSQLKKMVYNYDKQYKKIITLYNNNIMVKICVLDYPTDNEEQYKQHYEKFKYPLHDFQKWAIEGIVEGNHVLITAPTGTGKSMPAEFAIDFFHSKGKKSIYCSPIKSLSNQKFNDFTLKYPHISVGIITGDISSNPNADVLIMTTEILLNKLYQIKSTSSFVKSATSFDMDIEKELGCVIFDEIHMIGDKDRGHVWESSIMFMPSHVQMIGLSATLHDPEKFARWIETRGETVAVNKIVYLAKKLIRPVPLTHYSFITVNTGIYKAIKDKAVHEEIKQLIDKPFVMQDPNGKFNEEHYHRMNKMLKMFELKDVRVKRQHVLNQVSKYLVEKEMLPALCYVFSRKQLELCAHELTTPLLEFDSKVPYTIDYECEKILRNLPNFQEYLHLPEYVNLVGLLRKGIAIHHAGMMPILREIVEILFSRGMIKMLFCTTSVAIGLNLPVKTCIFTDICKHDGEHISILQGHEYVQAAGRAGRLGLDKVGNVIHLNNLFRNIDSVSYKTMLKGTPQILSSKFKISYNLILNLIDIGDTNFVSFAQKSMIKDEIDSQLNETDTELENAHKSIEKMKETLKHTKTPVEIVKEYIDLCERRQHAVNKKRKDIDRQIESIKDNYKTIETDKTIVMKFEEMKHQEETLMRRKNNIQQYISNNVVDTIELLKTNGFISTQNGEELLLTDKGKCASKLREIHCLVFSEFVVEKTFDELSAKQIIEIVSCFTNIKVKEDFKQITPKCGDEKVESIVKTIKNKYDNYMNSELELRINTGVDYEMHYDLIDVVSKWCDCVCVEDCKLFLQELETEKDIFLGEFVKAMLKINNICCEMESIAEQMGNIHFLSVLKQVPLMTMKYIVTNQSLYV
jgi:superfamily II RNA helicase